MSKVDGLKERLSKKKFLKIGFIGAAIFLGIYFVVGEIIPVGTRDISTSDFSAITEVFRGSFTAQSADGSTSKVDTQGRITVIINENSDMDTATKLMFKIAKFQIEHGEPFDILTFICDGPMQDSYGHQSISHEFIVSFFQKDLAQVVWANFNTQNFMNLAVAPDVYGPVGSQMITEYCNNSANQSIGFCTQTPGFAQ
jgi:hypothetical protein